MSIFATLSALRETHKRPFQNVKLTHHPATVFAGDVLLISMLKYSLSLLIFICANATAQHKVVADKIVGIVGDKVILHSDIQNAVSDLQRQNTQLPPDVECYIMEQQLIGKAMVLQAEKDSVVLGDDEIEALLDNQIRGFIATYGSKEALEEIAG